ncbi:MAG: GYD domain-containing protein [Planctomycetota bacterium]
MPKYLLQATYTASGLKALLEHGGSRREDAARAALESAGGRVEAFYFAFGDTDAFAIVDLPDNVSATAVALTTAASGAIRIKTTALLSPEEVDQAAKNRVAYHPPGS